MANIDVLRRLVMCAVMAVIATTANADAGAWKYKKANYYDIFPHKYQLHDEEYDFPVYHAEAPATKPVLWGNARLSAITLFDDPMTITKTLVLGLTVDLPRTDEAYMPLSVINFDGPADLGLISFFDKKEGYIQTRSGATEIYVAPYQFFETPANKSSKVTIFIPFPAKEIETLVNRDIMIFMISLLGPTVEESSIATMELKAPVPVIRKTLQQMATDLGLIKSEDAKPTTTKTTTTKTTTTKTTGSTTTTPMGTTTQTPPATSAPKADPEVIVPEVGGKHDYVDLGLPSGTLWATCNLGASSPDEPGYYICWGEKGPKEKYPSDNETYLYEKELLQKGYMTKNHHLSHEHDAAKILWGGAWRMPTYEECKELVDNCTIKEVKSKVFVLTSKINGNSITLPGVGYKTGTNEVYIEAPYVACYWTSSWDGMPKVLKMTTEKYPSKEVKVVSPTDNTSDPYRTVDYSFHGLQIRPVRK